MGQHREVLRHGMAEQRSEHADVKASAVPRPYHGLGVDFIGDPNAWGEVLKVGGGATVQAVAAVASYPNHSFRQDRKTAVTFGVHKFRSVVLPAQAVVDGQFMSRTPRILAVEEVTILGLHRVRLAGGSHIPVHLAHFREEERGQVHSADTEPIAGSVVFEVHLAGAVGVGWNAQVGGVPQVRAELELVIAQNLRPVVNELLALFLLDQGAIATGNVEGFAKVSHGPIEKEPRKSSRGDVGGVQARQPQSGCRGGGCRVEFRGVRVVTEVSESEVRQQRVAQRVVKARGQAIVVDQRLASQTQVSQSGAADGVAKYGLATELEVGVRVAAKDLKLIVGGIVAAHHVLIVVEASASAGRVVVLRSVIRPRSVGRRQQSENCLGSG